MSGRKPPPPPHLSQNYQSLLEDTATKTTVSSACPSEIFNHENERNLKRRMFDQGSYTQPYGNQYLGSQNFEIDNNYHNSDMKQSEIDSIPHHILQKKTDDILNLMKQFPRPVSTKEIIQNCGQFFKHPLQPILYDLHDRGLIMKCPGHGTQAWKLNTDGCSNQPAQFPHPFLKRAKTMSATTNNNLDGVSLKLSNTQSGGPPPPPHLLFKKSSCVVPDKLSNLHSSSASFHSSNHLRNRNLHQENKQQTNTATFSNRQQMNTSTFLNNNKQPPPVQQKLNILSSDTFSALNKNPVSALNELAQKKGISVSFELLCEGKGFRNKFTVAAMVGEQMFDAVSSSNMKDARRDAADVALRAILGKSAVTQQGSNSEAGVNAILNPKATGLSHFDNIAFLTHQAFSQICTLVQENFAGRKVIAGIVMKNGFDDETGQVVALGTGNRCISGQCISLEGKVVNDSHAEIICRRSFIRYMYSQLKKYYQNDESSIFEDGGMNGKAKIKDGISFHLYISTAPCGDGALFTPRENTKANEMPKEHTPVFSSKPHGILRTKIEDGEGTIPIKPEDASQSFDGILRGERLRTMSCSDKVCRWNVLGLQGALLSLLIEPIYLDSLTLGYLFDHGHLSRATCCRLDRHGKLDDLLPLPYYLNHPWVGRVGSYNASRETEKTNNISLNWCAIDSKPEITDGRIGACLTRTQNAPTPSRLCKLEMMKLFKDCISVSEKHKNLLQEETYSELKQKAVDFQKAKTCMFEKFQKSKFGQWVRKPAEQEMFGLI